MTKMNDKKPAETLYDEESYKPKSSFLKIILIGLSVAVLLITLRFLNHMLYWNMAKLELKNSKTARIEDFSFLGFSSYKKAQKKLLDFSTIKINEKVIVSYYDLVHPAVFIINNRGTKKFVNIGIMNVYPESGITTLFFHPTEIIESRRENAPAKASYYGTSLFPQLYKALAKQKSGAEKGRGISFILNPLEDAKYLKIPYMIYFYLPLLVILIMGANFRRFLISFFYYLGMFLLFDFKKVFFTGPFSWLTNLIGINISHTVTAIISALILTIFLIIGFLGIFYNRKREAGEAAGYYLTTWGKGLIVLFLLLPFVLRF